MILCPIERAHSKLWQKLEREFWFRMAEQARTAALRQGYAEKAGFNVAGQEVFVGVKGVTLMCPVCLTRYENCHPDTEEHPCWCPCQHPATKLQKPTAVRGVAEVTTKFFVNKIIGGLDTSRRK